MLRSTATFLLTIKVLGTSKSLRSIDLIDALLSRVYQLLLPVQTSPFCQLRRVIQLPLACHTTLVVLRSPACHHQPCLISSRGPAVGKGSVLGDPFLRLLAELFFVAGLPPPGTSPHKQTPTLLHFLLLRVRRVK